MRTVHQHHGFYDYDANGTNFDESFQYYCERNSFLVSAYSISAGVCGFIAAFFVDKFDRKNVLTIAYIGLLIGTFACAIAPTFTMLMLARIVAGVFGVAGNCYCWRYN